MPEVDICCEELNIYDNLERKMGSMISHGKDLKIFSGSSSKALARDICKELSIPLGNAETGAFSDGENYVSIF